jgi:acetyl-CoA C-acetyltransferase
MLGAAALKGTLQRTGLDGSRVDEVIFGNVLSAGLGQNVARQVALKAGMPVTVNAMTINKVCGSGLKAVMLAAQAIRGRDADVIIAGGTENMSAAPYLLPKARTGYRMGDGQIVDAMIRDGLWDVYGDTHMGGYGDRCAAKYAFSRQQQDDYAVESYRRALAAQQQGHFTREIVPVETADRKGVVTTVERDEEPLRFDEQKLRGLKPAFDPQGTVTAGNASSINDGAASVLVISSERADELGVETEARVLGYASASIEPEWFTLAPAGAIRGLLDRLGLTVADIDLFEINEAFSVVPMAAMRDLDIPAEKVNVHGGAVALGHPIGASGARTLVTLLNAIRLRNARVGITALCIGGGEAVAMAVERI